MTDEDLVRRFVSDGLSDAVDVLLRRHQDRVLGLAYRILGNRADALDASQEVFV
ncbi:MAG TPA: sigma factor, partial [Actinomycetota bacterium]